MKAASLGEPEIKVMDILLYFAKSDFCINCNGIKFNLCSLKFTSFKKI